MRYKSKLIKNLIALAGGLILISGFLLLTRNNVLSYDNKTTHPDLTREVLTFYELSTGKKLADEQKQWVIQGSIDEDFAPRWLNHFYDPVYERGLSTETPGVNGYSAKNWAQFSSYQSVNIGSIFNLWTGNGPVVSGSEWGDFSYEAAVKNYSQNKEKDAYYALGHVLHLIEDMTVPEHTRNDVHISGTQWTSYYENWAMTNSSGLTRDLGKRLFNQGKKPVIYGDLVSYFNDLAGYTNTHFFSPRTINSEIYQKPKIVFEDGTFAYGSDNGELYDLALIRKFGKDELILNNEQVLQEYWLRLSRQAVINGAGIINLFLNQAEAAKQAELAKQKVEAQQVAQKSSFFSSIINLFKNPGENNQPALTINSEVQSAQPKINSVAVQPKTESKPLTIGKPPTPTTTTMPAPTPTTTPTQTSTSTTQQPQTNAPIVYGGGGGSTSLTTSGGGSSSQPITNNTQQTTNNVENNSTVQTFNAGDLVINEIMYNLEGTDDKHEWIEIYNNSNRAITLTGGSDGWKFDDSADSMHRLNEPAAQGSMAVAVGGYMILADDAATFLADHPVFSGNVIDTVMDLKNSTSTIKIISPSGATIDEVTYSNFWGANGDGKTLERKSASGGSNDPNNWAESSVIGGTPGALNNWLLTSDVDSNASTTLAFDDTATSTPGTATSTLAVATSTEPILGLGTDVSATTTISEDTTWTLAGSPYRLFFDSLHHPIVLPNITLSIEPGAKIIPQGSGFTALEIKGALNAIATSGAPIIFTSINDADDSASTTPQKGDWLNIAFSQGSQGNLDYVEFRYGGQGIALPLHEMVNIVGATININHSKFENSQNTALHLVDSLGIVENSIFSDNICGISVDSSNGVANTSYGGCYGIHTTGQVLSSLALQIRNNQFIRNQSTGVEFRSGTAPIVDNNIFIDNGVPLRIESSYPVITNSQIANSTTSPNILNGIAISGYTHFSQNYTLKKDLPYILETNGPDLSPYIDSGATLTLEPGVIFKTGHTFTALNINGALIASSTPADPIIFTSFKDDLRGGDTNGDGSITSPQNNDWANIKFLAGSAGTFANTIFNYGGYGAPAAVSSKLLRDFSATIPAPFSQGSFYVPNNNPNRELLQLDHDGVFDKIIIHNLTYLNPNDYKILFRLQLPSYTTIASWEDSNSGGFSSREYTTMPPSNTAFVAGGKYWLYVTCDDGTGSCPTSPFQFSEWDGSQNGSAAAGAFYEYVKPLPSALSIDAGATVVIQ
ncbi:MAG: lamin tail domain-containing protein [Candidatus Azambacteria bacterium]|nr:lamin tail domain-containing protein [Candidatus Azambacteria bacterium]